MDNRPRGRGSAAPADPAQDAARDVPDEWVTNLVKGFAQTLRARQIYSPSNPTYQRFLNSLRSGLSDLWSKTDELTLEVEEEAMLWRGATVYRGEDKADSLAFLFFKDGVRELTFLIGFEKDELERFVEVLNRVRHLRPTDEDDLLTLLWNANFSRVQYASVDLFAEGLDIPEPTPQPLPAPSRVIREELPTEDEGGAAVETAGKDLRELTTIGVEDFDPTLYFLDASELERLRDEVGGEMRRDVRRAVLGALLDSLEDTGPREQDEVLGILQILFPYFLGHGELRLTGELLDQLTEIARREGVLAQPASQKLGVLLNELSTPSAIEELMRALETGALEPSADELAGFLRHLREGALGPLIRAANGLQQPEIRSVVEASVETMAGRYRAALIEQLRSRDPVVAAGAARLVGRLRFAEAARELSALMSRPEAAVRLAAVETAVSLRSPDAVRVLLDGLRDAERQVRVSAARGLGALHHQPAAEPLRAMIEGKDIQGADLTEKLAIFEAYGALNTPESVAVLDHILNGRGFLGRREPSEMRACAAVGLARSTLPTAKQALQKAEGDDDPVVRTAVARVLRGGAG